MISFRMLLLGLTLCPLTLVGTPLEAQEMTLFLGCQDLSCIGTGD